MDAPLVRRDVDDGVATLTLDSPRNRNALSRQLVAELAHALDAAVADAGVRVVLITGEGPAFCSGADLKEQRAPAESAARAAQPTSLAGLPAILTKLWSCPQPVVCRLNGLARAGGIGLLAACDVVVAPAGVSFSFTEVRIGVVPAVISVPVLRRVAAQAAHRLFLTGEVFDATYARDIGLVDEVAAEGELDEAVRRIVAMLMRGGPEALALTKQLSRSIAGLPSDEAFARMSALSARCFAGAEGQEGMRAFAERRDPAWLTAAYRKT